MYIYICICDSFTGAHLITMHQEASLTCGGCIWNLLPTLSRKATRLRDAIPFVTLTQGLLSAMCLKPRLGLSSRCDFSGWLRAFRFESRALWSIDKRHGERDGMVFWIVAACCATLHTNDVSRSDPLCAAVWYPCH